MGSHSEAAGIVKKALSLRKRYPKRSALAILNEAMKLRNGYWDLEWGSTDPDNPDRVHPDYDYENLPPAPFAEILRQAFAPDLDASKLVIEHELENKDYAISQLVTDSVDIWTQRVQMPFAIRYGIEGSTWFPCGNIVERPQGYAEPMLDKEVWLARFAGHLMSWGNVDLSNARSLATEHYEIETNRQINPIRLADNTLSAQQKENPYYAGFIIHD